MDMRLATLPDSYPLAEMDRRETSNNNTLTSVSYGRFSLPWSTSDSAPGVWGEFGADSADNVAGIQHDEDSLSCGDSAYCGDNPDVDDGFDTSDTELAPSLDDLTRKENGRLYLLYS